MRNVVICCYSEEWAIKFKEEANKLRSIFEKELIDIYHIGSTSVPGLKAKPIIDILPAVKDIRHVDWYNAEMKQMGYEPLGENGLSGRRFFQKGWDARTHHVHFYQAGSDEIKRHIAFRDYLKSHSDVRDSYGQLKEKLARQFPYDIDSYMAGKELFIKDIERKAINWFMNQ
ncbi:GrpB family protein [Bacillus massiliglaciei]|uniref:GrpB family protein n=1 Tax=Bacillus massiliglaciei TaxID=1816693 RepID=UPI000A889B30|nr:GrpB family protein [Bacillus massiliglaciei]